MTRTLESSEGRKAGRPDGSALPRSRYTIDVPSTPILYCEEGRKGKILKIKKEGKTSLSVSLN